MKTFFSFATLFVLLFAASCKKSDSTDFSTAFEKNLLNESYGSDPRQVMDIYLPANRSISETRMIALIHGGGWNAGDKSDFSAMVDTVKRRFPNFAIFNINYRLAAGPLNLFPTQEQDIRSAIEFINANRTKYSVSDKLALLGASAGGHLALLQAYKYETPIKVRAVIDFFGPSDMTVMYNNPAFPGGELSILGVVGTIPSLDSILYAQSSPINFVTATSSPTMILHGALDPLVRIAQSDSLFSRLDAANVAATYITYPTQGHGWFADTLTHSLNEVQTFLTTHMQ